MLQSGSELQNRYRIIRQIGGGGMGIVYLAGDNRLAGRHCAIKEMSPAQLPPQDRTWATDAFRQEAQILANLNHPGLTAVTDFFLEKNNWYLVMDHVEGQTLRDWMQRTREGRLPLNEALRITQQLCNVLEYLHGQSPPVVFRDLKPGNVMLTPQGEVKLIDFGIARFFKRGQKRDTVNLGTPGYAAPEQYGGMGQSDPRSDVYSLGALLLQMVTGYDPTAAVTPFPLPSPESLAQKLPTHLEKAISRSTQLALDTRYQSMGALRQALFPPTQTVQRSGTATLQPYALPTSPPQTVPFGWNKAIWALLGAAGILLLGLCVVIVVWFRSGTSTQPAVPAPTDTLAPETSTTYEPTQTATRAAPLTSTPLLRTPTVPIEPTSTPKPFSIVFDSYRDGHWEVYKMDENGSNVVNLTNHPANDGDPAWSFDGQRIAFDSDRDGNWEIYAMNIAGSGITRLTNHSADDEAPAWSPDNSRVTFSSNRDGNWEIYVVSLDDLSDVNLTNHSSDDFLPAWSPDGQRIAFVSDRTDDWDIWVMNVDGSGSTNLTRHSAKDTFPAWSPDSRKIAFSSSRDGNAEIYVMNVDGTGLMRLTNHSSDDWGPSWSPDDMRLAFVSERDGDAEVYIMNIDGSSVVQVTYNSDRDTWPVWSSVP